MSNFMSDEEGSCFVTEPMTQAQQIAAIWRETWRRQRGYHSFEAWNDGDAVHFYVDCEPITPA